MENKCCEMWGMVCCHCRRNLSPGSGGGVIHQKEVEGHFYCYECYPTIVEVLVTDRRYEVFKRMRADEKA